VNAAKRPRILGYDIGKKGSFQAIIESSLGCETLEIKPVKRKKLFQSPLMSKWP